MNSFTIFLWLLNLDGFVLQLSDGTSGACDSE